MVRLLEMKELRDKFLVFEDRKEGGRLLADFLRSNGVDYDVVLAIPNGGVAVGYEVSMASGKPLAVAVVRKITYPWTSEAGFGAVSWLGDVEVDEVEKSFLGEQVFERQLELARKSVKDRVKLFAEYLPESLDGLTVLLVDDGLATGYTMAVAAKAAKRLGAKRIIAAAPTVSPSAVRFVRGRVDLLVALNLRTWLPYAVADAYREWRDLSESEVLEMLKELRRVGLA